MGEERLCKKKMAEKVDSIDLVSDSSKGSLPSGPSTLNDVDLQEVKEIAQGVESVEISDDPDSIEISDHPEDIQIIGKKRGCSTMISKIPLDPKSSQMVQLTRPKKKITPGDIFRKTYFLGSDVQRQKIGNITKKNHYYKALTCLECDRTFHTRFGLEMHYGTIHPNGQPFNQMAQFEEIDCTELSDD